MYKIIFFVFKIKLKIVFNLKEKFHLFFNHIFKILNYLEFRQFFLFIDLN